MFKAVALTGLLLATTVAVGAVFLGCVKTVPSGGGSIDEAGVQRSPSELLPVGIAAPDFTATDHLGNTVKLADYRGKQNVVLIIYPANETPGCTAQLCSARDDFQKYADAGTAVFGVNPADAASHTKFAQNHNFPFPIIADTDGAVIRAFGARGIGGIPIRTVYAIDKDGKVVFAERGMPSTDQILASLG